MQPVGDLVLPCNTFRMLVIIDIKKKTNKLYTAQLYGHVYSAGPAALFTYTSTSKLYMSVADVN